MSLAIKTSMIMWCNCIKNNMKQKSNIKLLQKPDMSYHLRRYWVGLWSILEGPLPGSRSSSETQGQIVGARESLNGQKNMAQRKVKNGEMRPWGQCLTDQFQTLGAILPSDWCQKTFVFFCPIRRQKPYQELVYWNEVLKTSTFAF